MLADKPQGAEHDVVALERHKYLRNLFHQLVFWFTVFVTVNYATMGWLAGSGRDPGVVRPVAVLFLLQNTLSIFGCVRCRSMLLELSDQIPESLHVGTVRRLHSEVVVMFEVALGMIALAWIWLGFMA